MELAKRHVSGGGLSPGRAGAVDHVLMQRNIQCCLLVRLQFRIDAVDLHLICAICQISEGGVLARCMQAAASSLRMVNVAAFFGKARNLTRLSAS